MTRFRDALDILDLGDWLSTYADVRGGGDTELRLKECPECGNDKFKLYVNVEKKVWICYVCEWGRGLGDPVRLMSAVSGRTPFDIRVELAQTVIPAVRGTDMQERLQSLFDGVTMAAEERVLEDVELPGYDSFTGLTTKSVLEYALKRGLTELDVSRYHLRAATTLYIKKRTGNPVSIPGPFLVFPVFCAGKAVSWQGRKTVASDIPYVSASNVKDWLWPLNDQFFSIYKDRQILLVEGVFDALGFLRMGVPALCTFGKSMSDAQMSILRDLYPKAVLFGWDADAYKEMAKAVERVSYAFPNTMVVDFAEGATKKIDGGDALQDPEAGKWLMDRVKAAMDVRSPEFFQWRMTKV